MVLAKLQHATNDPRPLLDAVGLYMVGSAQRSFRDQARGSTSWPARGVPNRFGVLSDLVAGRKPPNRRWDDRPAAIDTGRLRQSIAYRVEGATRVVVGSSLPYASDVQRGGTRTLPLDAGLRASLAAWLRSLKGDRARQAQRAFGPLFGLGALTVRVPPRPFLSITREDRARITAMAADYFRGGYLTQ